jgi:hypothetical protein
MSELSLSTNSLHFMPASCKIFSGNILFFWNKSSKIISNWRIFTIVWRYSIFLITYKGNCFIASFFFQFYYILTFWLIYSTWPCQLATRGLESDPSFCSILPSWNCNRLKTISKIYFHWTCGAGVRPVSGNCCLASYCYNTDTLSWYCLSLEPHLYVSMMCSQCTLL